MSGTPDIESAVMRNSDQDNVLPVKHCGNLVVRVIDRMWCKKTCRISHAHTDAAVSANFLNSADEQTSV